MILGHPRERVANCFLTAARHSLWELCPEGRARSGLRNLNRGQICRKAGRFLSDITA